MPQAGTGWGPDVDRIASGGLAAATETRLKELGLWKGFTSFMGPSAFAVGLDAGITPVGQVVGFAGGLLRQGTGEARWRERSGRAKSLAAIRGRALGRLVKQAELLGANAVVGIEARRRMKDVEEGPSVEFVFNGTAVRTDSPDRPRDAPPLLTLASPQELSLLLRTGIEPVGIVASHANVQVVLSRSTLGTLSATGRWMRNAELPDLTKAVYECRRLALERLRADAGGLDADGIIGVDMDYQGRLGNDPPGIEITVDLLATAVRRRDGAKVQPRPVARMGDAGRG
jgi:uncharacterized protein YbjQ (UPF0145 family)